MAGLLSVPATLGERWGACVRKGRAGRLWRAGGEGTAKESGWHAEAMRRKRGRAGKGGRSRARTGSGADGEWVLRRAARGAGKRASPRPHPPADQGGTTHMTGRPAGPGRAVPGARARTGSRCPRVPRVCGRAPGRALWPGPEGSASMGAAWVGPLCGTRRAGGYRRLIPRRRWTGPGGEPRLPDCAWGRARGGRVTSG